MGRPSWGFACAGAALLPAECQSSSRAYDGAWARVDPDWLQGERLTQKMTVVRATGARHASIRFVTGMLDLMTSRSDFLEAARHFQAPILVLYGGATPRRSKAEMQALVMLPNVCSVELPSGKLGVHEEFPDEVARAVKSFLAGHGTSGRQRGLTLPRAAI